MSRVPARIATMLLLLAGAALPATGRAQAADADAAGRGEIEALIAALGDSGCSFQRNGAWHDAGRAQAHLQRKYDWARRRGMDGSAEQFIARAASRSSLSGRPYRVRCPGQPEADAGEWFRDVLRKIRVDDA